MSLRLVESPGCGKLVIAEPTALAVLDSDKIVVRSAPGETAQFSDARWEDRLPKLVQARILQSFENASRLRAVTRPAVVTVLNEAFAKVATQLALWAARLF
jgi:ABC-type uncharacterized transport system auxiliary subunit